MTLPISIRIKQDDEPECRVDTERYVQAKLRALKEFGYSTLTATTVREQLGHVLEDHTMDEGLDVIGMFIKGDIVLDEQQQRKEGLK